MMKEMRIGIDACFMKNNKTGIGIYIYDMICWFAKMDIEDEFYIYFNGQWEQKMVLPENWHIIEGKEKNFFLWQLFDLPQLIKKDKLDLFWEPSNRIPNIPSNVVLILTVHDLASYLYKDYCSWQTHLVEKLFLKRSCKKADKIIAISQYTLNDIKKYFFIQDKKLELIYDGDSPYKKEWDFDKELWKKIKKKYVISKEYFLVMGTLLPRKNTMKIIEAYNLYRKNGGEKMLLFAGKNSWKDKSLDEKIAKSEFSTDIVITGYVSEVEKEYLYRKAKALLFPSRYEGFGFPILEAMSVGTIVISSYCTSLPEVGGDAVLYLKDIDSEKELSELMLKEENMSDEERTVYIQKGFKQAQKFSREKCAEKILDVFAQYNSERR